MSFNLKHLDNILIFSLQEEISESVAKKIVEEITSECKGPTAVQKFALDLSNKHTIATGSFRIFNPLAIALRKSSRSLFILDPPSELLTFIKDLGLSSLFKPALSLDAIQKESLAPPPAKATLLDVNFVNPFIQAAIKTLKVQCNADCVALKATVREKMNPVIPVDIAAFIGLTSDIFQGSISICFPKSTFLNFMSAMMDESFTEISKDLEEGASEILNVIFGQAKKVLNEQGHTFEPALPAVIRGENLEVKHMTVKPAILIPFTTASGLFYLEIGVRSKS